MRIFSRHVSPFDTRVPSTATGRVHAEVEELAVLRFLLDATALRTAPRGETIQFLVPAVCPMMSQYLSSADRIDTEKKTDTREILISSEFDTSRRGYSAPPPCSHRGGLEREKCPLPTRRFVSEVQRISRRHISRITRASTEYARECERNRTNGRGKRGEGWLRGGGWRV